MQKVVFAAALLVAAGTVARAKDAPMKLELENDAVRVLRMRLAPHERIPMHTVPPHLAVWLTDARLRVTYPDGHSEEKRYKAGEVQWVTLGAHAGENVGDTPI